MAEDTSYKRVVVGSIPTAPTEPHVINWGFALPLSGKLYLRCELQIKSRRKAREVSVI